MSPSASSPALTRPRAVRAWVDDTRLWVSLQDGREVGVPLAWFSWLSRAADDARRDFHLIGGGAGIWWDQLEDGISIPLLLGLPEDA